MRSVVLSLSLICCKTTLLTLPIWWHSLEICDLSTPKPITP
jgi:hypothetical protein